MYYRKLAFILACTIAAAAAPQNDGTESEITYVKIQPVTERNTQPKSIYRESRIENIPLTIPGKVTDETIDVEDADVKVSKPDGVSKLNGISKHDTIFENDVSIKDDNDVKRRVRSEDTTENYESETVEPTTGATESVEDLISQTEEYEARTRAPSPRFLSKLSYFQKDDDDVRTSIATNLVERAGKRRFKSKCRCEKIWNCPKLQITVPRCPNEYFLCCF